MIKLLMTSAILLMLTSIPAAAQRVNDCGKGLVNKSFTPSAAPLLNRFDFDFDGTDHHIQQILIFPNFTPATIRIGYHDKNSDDRYCYDLNFVNINDSRIQRFRRNLDICSEGGKCTVRLNRPPGDFVFVLIGFQLSFRGTDHHVDEVSVLEDNGQLTVAFNDKNNDDIFIWSAQFAYVPRDRFRNVGESSGVRAKGEAVQTIPSGTSLIRGFRFKFRKDDHHIKRIGVRSSSGQARMLFSDKNRDDEFDWQYRWAILR